MKKVVFVVLVLLIMLAAALPAFAYGTCPGHFTEEPASIRLSVDTNGDDTICLMNVTTKPNATNPLGMHFFIDNVVPSN